MKLMKISSVMKIKIKRIIMKTNKIVHQMTKMKYSKVVQNILQEKRSIILKLIMEKMQLQFTKKMKMDIILFQ